MDNLGPDLLELAEQILGSHPRSQACLRRAVSTAYYALFHLLIFHSAKFAAKGSSRSQELRPLLARAFNHAEMKNAAFVIEKISKHQSISQVLEVAKPTTPLPNDLLLVAQNFVSSQDLRHQTEYNLHKKSNISIEAAKDAINDVKDAFAAWERLTLPANKQDRDFVEFFLVILLHHNKLQGRQ